ncbi:RNA-directed DNA polymerase [Methylobacter marinus]|uniref:RNA-directed DNA polymerase n=1 Tax=Methylobacter marinus TaxID=34058 RepID=UPI00035CDE78|nr:RNA-directed DNA polymerase [Methylobacter marinus]
MTLKAASIEWAVDFIQSHSDGDLFPKVLEIEAIISEKAHFVSQIADKDLSAFVPGVCRRFIVPKDEISYRQATQLDPQDSVILSSIIYEYGGLIESRRLSPKYVYSYRFKSTVTEGLYNRKTAWNDFWVRASKLSEKSECVLYCDIADFYNQVYHHTVENQLIAAGLPNQAVKWLVSLLESTTEGVSRGVPIGPHPIHLIAESTLIPVDNSLKSGGMNFIRYADDILIFRKTKREAKTALATVATVLDKQQRLTLQRYKTKFYEREEFKKLCSEMIEDRPINTNEKTLLALIKKYSGGDPYSTISYSQISPTDWASISPVAIHNVIESYINAECVDYIRLRWFYRRLAQIGHPGAIDVSLDNLERLGPCFSNICFYLGSVQSIAPADWKRIGGKLIGLLRTSEVQSSEYFRLLILSLFTRNNHINHFDKLQRLYQKGDAVIRREIILASRVNSALDWTREHKESFRAMDPWLQSAFIYAVSGFPKDEKKYFINRQKFNRPFELTLAKWVKSS